MSGEINNRFFDVQAAVGAIPVRESESTTVIHKKLLSVGHYPFAIQKEISDTVGKMSCAKMGGVSGPDKRKILRLSGVSKEECPNDCYYLQGGIHCVLYLIMINKENARFIPRNLAKEIVLG